MFDLVEMYGFYDVYINNIDDKNHTFLPSQNNTRKEMKVWN